MPSCRSRDPPKPPKVLPKVLPARRSRGNRIQKLLGEEAEADASFWGQEAWQEDGDDEDYSTEAEEEDVVDSDFDNQEAPDDEVHDAKEDEKLIRRKRVATSSGRYKEPTQSRPAKRQILPIDHKPPVMTVQPASVFEYVAPTVRFSTTRKSSESSEMRRRASQEAAKLAAKSKKPTVEKACNRFTQAQLIAEAVKTEVENTQSLQRLERLEEEKKAENVAPKAPFTGKLVRYYSKLGTPKTITFLNPLDFPPIFNQPKPKKRISSQQQKSIRLKVEQEEDDHAVGAQEDGCEEKDWQQQEVVQTTTPTAAQAVA